LGPLSFLLLETFLLRFALRVGLKTAPFRFLMSTNLLFFDAPSILIVGFALGFFGSFSFLFPNTLIFRLPQGFRLHTPLLSFSSALLLTALPFLLTKTFLLCFALGLRLQTALLCFLLRPLSFFLLVGLTFGLFFNPFPFLFAKTLLLGFALSLRLQT